MVEGRRARTPAGDYACRCGFKVAVVSSVTKF